MEETNIVIKTPRGKIPVHTVYDSLQEARADGWGIWFYHEAYIILSKANHVGAVTPNPYFKGEQ